MVLTRVYPTIAMSQIASGFFATLNPNELLIKYHANIKTSPKESRSGRGRADSPATGRGAHGSMGIRLGLLRSFTAAVSTSLTVSMVITRALV